MTIFQSNFYAALPCKSVSRSFIYLFSTIILHRIHTSTAKQANHLYQWSGVNWHLQFQFLSWFHIAASACMLQIHGAEASLAISSWNRIYSIRIIGYFKIGSIWWLNLNKVKLTIILTVSFGVKPKNFHNWAISFQALEQL